MTHFARQLEGSKDFYDFIEHNFHSEMFDDCNIDDFIALGHNYYLVHSGSVSFFCDYSDKLLEKMDESISTYNILRVLQTFAEVGPKFPDIFNICEFFLLKRYEQLMIEEIVCAAACFSIAGQGSKTLYNLFEKQVCRNPNIDFKTLRDICKAFIYSMRGSENIFKIMEPRIRSCLDSFTVSEK
jgi:hypothetical protein